jgi:hypothetical protein
LVSFAMNFQYGVKCYFIYNKLDIDPQGPVTIFTRSFLNPYIYYYTKKCNNLPSSFQRLIFL